MPTSRNRSVCFFKLTCHQMDNCFYILFLWTTKNKGKISSFSPFETFFYNTLKLDLKECVNSIIKLSDLSSKSMSLQANYYLNSCGSLSNAYI